MTAIIGQTSRAERLKHEFMRSLVVTLYLYVCFGAVVLYKTALLRSHNIDFAPWGLAIVKAFIVAKFVHVGHSLRLGKSHQGKPLISFLAYQTAFFVALVMVLSSAENLIIGALHGKSVRESLPVLAGDWFLIVAQCVLLLLILIPYLGLGAINDALPPGQLRRMFFGTGR